MHTTTLITAPLEHCKFRPATPMISSSAPHGVGMDSGTDRRRFKIESADSFVVRQSANALLQQRYGWRGYQTVSLPADQTADRTTLTATEDSHTIGTITVGLDGPSGLSCEQGFGAEVEELRKKYGRVCEFTKLAIDPVGGTNRVLAALFHVAYIVAHRLRQCGAVVMEVNPRHVRFYQRLLGGKVCSESRLNASVNAPAVLLVIDFSYAEEQIKLLAWQADNATQSQDRSVYSLFFSEQEEVGILRRLIEAQTAASTQVN